MKRRGVIMALMASCRALLQGQNMENVKGISTWIRLEIPRNPPLITFGAIRPVSGDNNLFSITRTEVHPFDFALEVRFEGRVVRLTASEIMDALEGK